MIAAKIIKDSINSVTNDRLTTFILTYPRFVHAELMTHRAFSRNAASTRAIPTHKIIQAIIDDPALPVFWGKNQSGMQANVELDDSAVYKLIDRGDEREGICKVYTEKTWAQKLWLEGRNQAIDQCKKLIEVGLHKQIAGRILEPWFNITVLVSATEWENWFALRSHNDAQPEIHALSDLMLEEYNQSIPEIKVPVSEYWEIPNINLSEQNWHIPFEENMPNGLNKEEQLKVAIARCARLSYLTFDGEMNVEKDYAIYDKLLKSNPKHASPAEHVAYPLGESWHVGNFKGWVQYRKLLPQENQTDSRVIRRKVVNGKVI